MSWVKKRLANRIKAWSGAKDVDNGNDNEHIVGNVLGACAENDLSVFILTRSGEEKVAFGYELLVRTSSHAVGWDDISSVTLLGAGFRVGVAVVVGAKSPVQPSSLKFQQI